MPCEVQRSGALRGSVPVVFWLIFGVLRGGQGVPSFARFIPSAVCASVDKVGSARRGVLVALQRR